MSMRHLKHRIEQAHTPEQLRQIACYLTTQSVRFEALAAQQDAALRYSYEHHVGGPKYPSAADHARTFRALYKEKALRYSNIAQQLEAQAARDAPIPQHP